MEQIKKLYLVPSNIGIEMFNSLVMQLIVFILNIYGKRLLKLNVDKLIKNYTSNIDCNLFYFYPFSFEEVGQTFLVNSLNIKKGTIDNLVISIPRKIFPSNSMIITIENIDLTLSVLRNNSIYFSASSQEYLDLSNGDNLDENGDLIDIFREINSILHCYFDKIKIEIKTINVKILDHFIMILNEIRYENHIVFVEKINIKSLENEPKELAKIEEVNFDTYKFFLSVRIVNINKEIIQYLPILYVSDPTSNVKLNVFIGSLTFEKVNITNLDILVDPDKFVIKSCENLEVIDILIFKHSKKIGSENDPMLNPFLLYYIQNNTFLINQTFEVNIVNLHDLKIWIKHLIILVRSVVEKIVTMNEKNMNSMEHSNSSNFKILGSHFFQEKSFHFDNIRCNVVYDKKIYFIEIKRVYYGKIIKLVDLKIKYDDIIITSDNILVENDGTVRIVELSIITSKIPVEVPNCLHSFYIKSNNVQIKKTDNELSIALDHSRVFKFPEKKECWQSNLSFLEFIHLTKKVTEQFRKFYIHDSVHSSDDNVRTPHFMFEITYFDMSVVHNNYNINIIVHNASINITQKVATNIIMDISINKQIVGKICAKKLSKKYFEFSSIKIFLNPEVFDYLNYLFGLLMQEKEHEENIIPPEALEHLKKALEQSIIVNTMDELKIYTEKKMQKIVLTPTSIHTLPTIIENYFANKDHDKTMFKLSIVSIHIYLSDRISYSQEMRHNFSSDMDNISFLCVIMKNIEFERKVGELVGGIDEPKIRIVEMGTNKRPKIKTNYMLKINTIAILDLESQDPEWKYFIKFGLNTPKIEHSVLDINVTLNGNNVHIQVHIDPVIAHIREEILLRVLAFFSNSHHFPKENTMFVEYFSVNGFSLYLNYYPIILKRIDFGLNHLALKNHQIRFSPITLCYVDNFTKLFSKIGAQWKSDINPNNIFQFVPNINIIQPYTTPIVHFVNLISGYFKHPQNKRKIKKIIKAVGDGSNIVTLLVKTGINRVSDLFR